MGILAKAAKFATSLLVGGVGGLAGIKGSKKGPQARLTQRDGLQAEVERDDELRKRRGAAADMVTGTAGAALPGSSVGRLVVGS